MLLCLNGFEEGKQTSFLTLKKTSFLSSEVQKPGQRRKCAYCQQERKSFNLEQTASRADLSPVAGTVPGLHVNPGSERGLANMMERYCGTIMAKSTSGKGSAWSCPWPVRPLLACYASQQSLVCSPEIGPRIMRKSG